MLAAVAGTGTYLLYSGIALRGTGRGARPRRFEPTESRAWLAKSGLEDVRPAEFLAVVATLALGGALVGWVVFGGIGSAVILGLVAAIVPVAAYQRRAQVRRALANDAWPRLIDEVRVLTSASGRAIPQALFEAGRHAPEELRPAFVAAEREWLLTTDFERTLDVLKAGLADPTADVACETLLVANAVGGTDLTGRLEALAADRRQDVHDRKDARARQAGVRFARRFVLIVPLGMAVAGMSIGSGREAYSTPQGQILVIAGVVIVGVCWVWAGRLMRLPIPRRVFPESGGPTG